MPGIGGTGVVTVNQIVATAAELDGLFVTGLDQPGLAQKGGAVVSDLRITASPVSGPSFVVAGALDAYIVFDLLAGTAPATLLPATPDRTVAGAMEYAEPTVNANIALQYGWNGSGIGVAVIDSGIYNHPDLNPRIVHADGGDHGFVIQILTELDVLLKQRGDAAGESLQLLARLDLIVRHFDDGAEETFVVGDRDHARAFHAFHSRSGD